MDDFVIESVCLVRAEHVSGAAKFPAPRSAPFMGVPRIAPFRGDF